MSRLIMRGRPCGTRTWVVVLFALGIFMQAAWGKEVYRAYSLQRAAQSVEGTKGALTKEVISLGGITRPMHLVLDGEQKDIILVGEVVKEQEPAQLDDLVVALRAVEMKKAAPLVSIDRTANTDSSGKQKVRFEGGVEDTQFGKDLLDADIILKKLGLGLLPMPKGGAGSYAELAAKQWLDSRDELFLSRFWFKPSRESRVKIRKNIALLDAVSVVASTETVATLRGSESVSRDSVGEQFATDISYLLESLAESHKPIRRLEPLLRLAGLMQAIPKWEAESAENVPDLSVWLKRYPVRQVPTDREVKLLRSKSVRRALDQSEFSVDGGIDTEMLIADLKDGDEDAVRQIVLLARPSSNALSWDVPLGGESSAQLVRSFGKSKKGSEGVTAVGSPAMSLRERVRMPDGRELGARLMQGTSLHGSPPVNKIFREAQEGRSSVTSGNDSRPKVVALGRDRVQDLSAALHLAGGGNGRTAIVGTGRDLSRIFRDRDGPQAGLSMSTSFYVGSHPIERRAFEPTPILNNLNRVDRERLASGRAGLHGLVGVGDIERVDFLAGSRMRKRPDDYPHALDRPKDGGPGGAGYRREDWPAPGGGLARQMGDAIGRSTGGAHGFSPGVGGVMLRGEARALDDDSELTAGDFSLIFDESGVIGITGLRRFVTALWATYLTEVGPGISIDPISSDFTGPHAVRYIGNVINSDLGRVMREADYLMKSWSVGTSKPDVPNWKTPENFAKKRGVVHLDASRFWFVPEEMVFRRAGDRLMFEDGRMTLKTEYLLGQQGNASGGTAVPQASAENEDWAAMFTQRYAELAAKHPVLAELAEYAQYVSLAKYLKQRKVPMLWFLLANRELVLTEDSPGTVESFAHKSKVIKGLEVHGGVELNPGGSFVWDAALRAAVTKAAESTKTDGNSPQNPEIPVIIDDEANTPPAPEVPAQTVVIGEANEGEAFATDVGIRKGPAPVLELARFRRNDLPLVQSFGRDWHLLIPFSLRPASNKRMSFQGEEIPEAMILRNVVSGNEEEMIFDPERYKIAGYVPTDASASVNIGLFFLTDGTLRLADKLGCEYQFDRLGRLTQMILTPQFGASFEYDEKALGWRDYGILPFRFEADGEERTVFRNTSFPTRLKLIDADAGTEELFVFVDDGPNNMVGYLPESPPQSAWWFAALKTDGTLTLAHRSGRTIEFDAAGHFLREILNVVKTVKSGLHEVSFEYAMIANQYRISSAAVNQCTADCGTEAPIMTPNYRLDYAYDDHGEIEECVVAAIGSE